MKRIKIFTADDDQSAVVSVQEWIDQKMLKNDKIRVATFVKVIQEEITERLDFGIFRDCRSNIKTVGA